jgi:D-alanyl-D-alanine carboxypeptidase
MTMPLRLLSMVAAALTPAAPELVQVPQTPAGQAFSSWQKAFNAGDPALLAAVFERFVEPRPVQAALGFRRVTGGFDLVKVVASSPTHLSVLLQERLSDRLAAGDMDVEAAAPHRVVRWGLQPVPRPPEMTIARMSEAELWKALKARLDLLAGQGLFSGSVLIARHDKVLFTDVRGAQDRDKGVPNRLDTRFNLGSMNKMFTAVSIAQLEQAGKLKVTDTVGKHIPDYPNRDVASKVTIHHLLTHTGGTGDTFGPERDANLDKIKEPKDYIALYGKRPLRFEPGSQFEYSNYGMVLAGAIVERASHMSYYDYVRKNIYDRAGMKSSDSYWKNQETRNLAQGYVDRGGALRSNQGSLGTRGSPAGGGYSTCEDLLRFAGALTGHKLLDAAHTTLVTTGKPGTPHQSYGYGFGTSNEGGVRSFGHNGGAPGINADFKIFPDSGYVLVVLGNLDPPSALRVSDFIAARLPAK